MNVNSNPSPKRNPGLRLTRSLVFGVSDPGHFKTGNLGAEYVNAKTATLGNRQ